MEHNNVEVALIQDTVAEVANTQLRELIDLQLALVGGGTGEVTPY
jgi:hypothetical protein